MHVINKLVGKKTHRLQNALLIFLTFFLMPQFSYAAYQLDKVRIFLTQKSFIDTLKVTNSGDAPINVQAQIYSWTMVNGKQDLQPSNDIIVSPPIMKVPPNKTQLLRVGWRQPTALVTEKTYRLFIQEITPEKPLTQTGVHIRLRLGVPIFVAPTNPVYQLDWKSEGLSGKKFKVLVSNTGNVHTNLVGAVLKTDDGRTVGAYPGSTYVFPGQSATIEFTMTDTGTKNLTLDASTDYKQVESKITLP